MALFTVENARSMSGKAAAARKNRRLERAHREQLLQKLLVEKAIAPAKIEPPLDTPRDPIAESLTRAIEETLQQLRDCPMEKARDRACLARALRDLRETYHLFTGEARPGIKKHDGRVKRPVALEPQPTSEPVPTAINAPACGSDATTNGG